MAVRKRVKKIIRRSSNSSKNHHNVNNAARQTVKINIGGGVNPGQPGSRPFQGGSTSIVVPGPPPPPQTPWTIVEKNYAEKNPFKTIPQGQRAVDALGAPAAPVAIGANGPQQIVNQPAGGMNVVQPRSSNDAVLQRPNTFYENALRNVFSIGPKVPRPNDDASHVMRGISANMGPIEPIREAEIEEKKSSTENQTQTDDLPIQSSIDLSSAAASPEQSPMVSPRAAMSAGMATGMMLGSMTRQEEIEQMRVAKMKSDEILASQAHAMISAAERKAGEEREKAAKLEQQNRNNQIDLEVGKMSARAVIERLKKEFPDRGWKNEPESYHAQKARFAPMLAKYLKKKK
jgi:hypothetical protein